MISLTEIANGYATDKGSDGPSLEWGAHYYTNVYEAYFARSRHDEITLLEIGLGVTGDQWESLIVHGRNQTGGASAKMWRDYFTHGEIYGIDINPAGHIDGERLHTAIVDQGDIDALSAYMANLGELQFDYIIDDGSHRPDHQQISFDFFFKYVKPGGLYIIEDLHDNGKGSGKRGRTACDAVICTRDLFKSYLETGNFEAPHLLTNIETVRNSIAFVAFHGLKQGVSGRHLRYIPNTERICVIGKL